MASMESESASARMRAPKISAVIGKERSRQSYCDLPTVLKAPFHFAFA